MCVGWLEIQGASAGEMASAPPPPKAADGANSTRGAGFMGALNRFLRFRGNRVRSNGGTPGFSNTTGGGVHVSGIQNLVTQLNARTVANRRPRITKYKKTCPRPAQYKRVLEYLSRYGIR